MASAQFPRETVGSDRTVSDPETVQAVMDALDDRECRTILEETNGESLSANDIAERCDLPLSTTYRKLDLLTEAGLLAERTRIGSTGTHASEYRRRFEDVTVTMSDANGIEVTLTCRDAVENQQSLVVEAD